MLTVLSIVFLISGVCFLVFAVFVGPLMPSGPAPFYGFGAFCTLVGAVLWWYRHSESAKDRGPSITPPANESWFARKGREVVSFDLSRLNFYGWALFVTSVAVMMLVVAAGVHLLGNNQDHAAIRIIAIVAIGLGLLWFQLGKLMFEWGGASIYRAVSGESPEQ